MRTDRRLRPIFACAGLCLLVVAACVPAADLQVSPISVEFKPSERAGAVWLANSGVKPLHAQVRVMRWTQADGKDVLQETHDFVLSPPLVAVAPGAQQLVRLIRAGALSAGAEGSYRLLIDELPPVESRPVSGLQFLFNYSVPVFVTPDGLAPLSERGASSGDVALLQPTLDYQSGHAVLQIANRGRQRVRLSELAFVSQKGVSRELVPGLLGYVLAGSRMSWTLAIPAEDLRQGGALQTRINNGSQAQTLLVVAPAH